MKLLLWLLKKLYINRKAYALNEYRYFKENPDKEYESFWKMEIVIIEGFSVYQNKIEYDVRDAVTFERWNEYVNNVYLTKRSAAKAFSKITK